MDDIVPGLLKQIQEDFQKSFDKSEVIGRLYAKIRDGTAAYKEANDFAIEVGDILADAYKDNLSSEVLPDGKMYYNIAERIINPTMTNNYELITDVTEQVQQSLNKKAGIGIKAIKPDLEQDRIAGIVNKISVAENYDEVAWVLDEPVKNFSQSIVDNSIKTNAEFQYKVGMSPKIVRTSTGKCCDWCNKVVGVHDYEKVREKGNDVFRRHNYCRCMVEYDPGDGKVQDVHTKKISDRNDAEQRIENSRAYEERTKTREKELRESRKTIGFKDTEIAKEQRIQNSKELTPKDLNRMSLAELQRTAKEIAEEYYKTGLSGISFPDDADYSEIAEALSKSGSRTSLKKDILSMQKKMRNSDRISLENTSESSTIKLQDTLIHKSVGAKSQNYDVLDPNTGEVFHFAEGTRIQNSEVFAGKGTRKPLHEGVAEGLSEQIGGTPENWQHCKGNGVVDYYGEERPAEVHWFQEESVGKVKFKVKEWKDED